MKKLLFIFTILLFIFCERQIEEIKKFNWKDIMGTMSQNTKREKDRKQNIKELEKKVAKYEKEISKKIQSAKFASFLYRRIGKAYAEIEAFPLCVENLERAITLGYIEDDIFWELGICQANLASQKNWDYNLIQKAEATFLALLQKYPHYKKAYYPLSLIYFYGFSASNYRIIYGEKIYHKHFFTNKKG